MNYDRVGATLGALQKYHQDLQNPKKFEHFARFLSSAAILLRSIAAFFPNMQSRADYIAKLSNAYQHHLASEERVIQQVSNDPTVSTRYKLDRRVPAAPTGPVPTSTTSDSYQKRTPARKTLLPTPPSMPSGDYLSEQAAPAPTRSQTVREIRSPLSDEQAVRGSPSKATTTTTTTTPSSASRLQSQRQLTRQAGQSSKASVDEVEPVYFSFSEGQRQTEPSSSGRFSFSGSSSKATPPPRTSASSAHSSSAYAACQDMISEDIMKTVYDYFQQFGTAVCNYTGSCCVKTGVRFSLAFTASGAPLESSLHDVTEAFGRVLQSMKKLITEVGATIENATSFLYNSSEVMRLIGRADPQLATKLPNITPDGLLRFVMDSGGATNLAAGYDQFCDFNNCLEKCWLVLQRTNTGKGLF